MFRNSSSTAGWWASLIAATGVAVANGFAAEPATSVSEPVRGEMVDTDTPTTYRLPVVGIFDPPTLRIAERTTPAKSSTRVESPASNETMSTSSPSPIAPAAPPLTVPIPTSYPAPAAPSELTTQLLPAVQRGYNLAQRGALFAARTEFVQVLRRVAQAKDAALNNDTHAKALASGLRALDEADDFVPQGAQVEADLDVRRVASSHRTPVLRDYPEDVSPQEAVEQYLSYAEQQLSNAAADEQAGSMALYGLGKVFARQAERRDDDVQLTRDAMTMYSAALDACPENHLAANELGVLLCRTGHPAEAAAKFQRAIDLAPTATAYHNLAVAQQKLGQLGLAAANEQESQRLAAVERASGSISRRAGVQWVSPADLARVTQPAEPVQTIASPATNTAAKPGTGGRSVWR